MLKLVDGMKQERKKRMSEVILNGIDVSEALDKLKKVKKLLEVVKLVEQAHRTNGWECFNKGLEKEAQYYFGKADSCLATINDLEMIIGDDE